MKVKDLIKNSIIAMPRQNKTPKVSIFLPTYRRFQSGYFKKSVDSLLAQTHTDFELIIIDDCSSDGSFDLIQEYHKLDARVGYVRHTQNIGLPAVSIFEAYQLSKGEYILSAFDDNELFSDSLEKMLGEMDRKNADILYAYVNMLIEMDGQVQTIKLGSQSDISDLISHNFIANNAVLARRNVFETVGWYDPHIIVSRICDWDLWRRIAKIYKIERFEHVVGTEHGPILSDSLGSTYDLSLWAVEEWFKAEWRTEALKIENYLEYDVKRVPETASVYLEAAIKLTLQKFSSKFWSEPQNTKKNIMVISPHIDASCLLSFEDGLPEYIKRQINLRMGGFSYSELCTASAVIFVRDLLGPWHQEAIQVCEKLNIPMGYYTDDNFFALAQTQPEYAHWNLNEFKNITKKFSFFLTSTKSLQEFFSQNGFKNVFEYPHVSRPKLPPMKNNEDGHFNVAFIGGVHREKDFKESILPALRGLAQQTKLRLVTHIELSAAELGDLKCVRLQKTLSLDQLLVELKNLNTNVILHSTAETENDVYKTCHMLILARAISAGFLVSDHVPYSDLKSFPGGKTLLVASQSWLEPLKELVFNKEIFQQNVRQVEQLVHELYSGKKNELVLNAVLKDVPNASQLIQEALLVKYVEYLGFKQAHIDSSVKKLGVKMAKLIYCRSRIFRFIVRSLLKFKIFIHLKNMITGKSKMRPGEAV